MCLLWSPNCVAQGSAVGLLRAFALLLSVDPSPHLLCPFILEEGAVACSRVESQNQPCIGRRFVKTRTAEEQLVEQLMARRTMRNDT